MPSAGLGEASAGVAGASGVAAGCSRAWASAGAGASAGLASAAGAKKWSSILDLFFDITARLKLVTKNTNTKLWSISSTLNEQILCTKAFFLVTFWLRTNFCTKNAHIKC